MLKHVFCTLFCFFISWCTIYCQSQKLSQKYINYINKYSSLAQKQQKLFGIPASITLAQGLLESQCGESRLATVGNNHFGIKCANWTGDTILHDDDKINDCFRRYSSAEESFSDHSLFLKRKRYSPLFQLSITDYAGWARTLKQCGYATDPAYPDKLIRIIETYELFKYDGSVSTNDYYAHNKKENIQQNNQNLTTSCDDSQLASEIGNMHVIRRRWGLYYVVAHDGDTFESLSAELNIKPKDLAKYNDLKKSQAIAPGEIIWIQQKEKEAAMGNDTYTVKNGDTLHSIAQYYGIKLKNLAHLNNMKESQELTAGYTINLR